MLEVINKNINDLVPYISNSRTHSNEQINQISASIKEFGFTNPILLDGDNGVIAGHGRLEAAQKIRLDTVPCIELSHLTEAQKKAYIIADNQLSISGSDWDIDLLKIEVEGLQELDFDIDLLGFDNIDDLIGNVNFLPATEAEQGQLDELDPIYVHCPECGKEFNTREC